MSNVLPVPISPSRSDVQTSDAAKLPSSASSAVPVKVTDSPRIDCDASAGVVMETAGFVLR